MFLLAIRRDEDHASGRKMKKPPVGMEGFQEGLLENSELNRSLVRDEGQADVDRALEGTDVADRRPVQVHVDRASPAALIV
jgi:hypothetical protein